MAVWSWEQFVFYEALMMPGDVPDTALEEDERTGLPVDLEIGSDSVPSCVWCGEMVDSAHSDARICSTDCREKYKAFKRRNPGAEPANA